MAVIRWLAEEPQAASAVPASVVARVVSRSRGRHIVMTGNGQTRLESAVHYYES